MTTVSPPGVDQVDDEAPTGPPPPPFPLEAACRALDRELGVLEQRFTTIDIQLDEDTAFADHQDLQAAAAAAVERLVDLTKRARQLAKIKGA